MRTVVVAAVALASVPVAANAKIVTICGSLKGQSYYAEEGKWSDDGISSGRFIFDRDDSGAWTIYFQDSTGNLKNTKDDGGKVISLSDSGEGFLLAVAYPGYKQIESYSLIKQGGKAQIFYSMNRDVEMSGVRFTKVSAFIGNCE